jgi:hypothetical protein
MPDKNVCVPLHLHQMTGYIAHKQACAHTVDTSPALNKLDASDIVNNIKKVVTVQTYLCMKLCQTPFERSFLIQHTTCITLEIVNYVGSEPDKAHLR